MTSSPRRENCHTLNALEMSLKDVRSAPALNERSPAPVTTTHRMASSLSSSARALSSSSKTCGLIVFSRDRKSTRLNSSHQIISYAVFCLKKKKNNEHATEKPDFD